MTLREQIEDAKKQVAETAIATPYVFNEYLEWQTAAELFVAAKRRLKFAEDNWLQRINPALSDPLLKKLALRKNLIPRPLVRRKKS